MLIHGGLVYTPSFKFERQNIRIKNGKIKEVTERNIAPEVGEEVVDAEGMYCIPGLTDIHFHGCMGADTNDASDKALHTMAVYQRAHGVMNICPATMTLPEDDVRKIVMCAFNHKAAEDEADLVGINLEGPFISPARVGAQNPEYVHTPDAEFLEKLLDDTKNLPKVITIAPEVPGAIDCIEKLHDRIRFSIGHTMATYEDAVKGFNAGARHLTHMYNAMPGITHRAPGPIAAASERGDVTAEIICDGVHIAPAAIRLAFKLMGAGNMILISDSTRACGMEDGQYDLGGQTVYKRDNAAWLNATTLAGSTTNVYDCMLNAIKFGIPKEDAVRAATYNPAMAIGILKDYGTIEEGKKSGIVITDKQFAIQKVLR